MKRIKRSFGVSLSVLILLSFSMTFVPLDFLHNHAAQTQVSCVKDATDVACNHKLHITKKVDFCWVCAVHFDKTFTKPIFVEKLKLSTSLSLFVNNETAGYFLELLFTGLRGPPAE